MICVPTSELCGVLSDAIPFASPDAELSAVNAVSLEWDGNTLHALATDRYRISWSKWSSDDDPDETAQDDMFTTWGGADGDEPWTALLWLADAKEIVNIFKLPPKLGRAPLTVECEDQQVTVRRSRDTGHSAVAATFRTSDAQFPDIRKLLADSASVEDVSGLAFSAKFLADFAKVRPRGPLEMRFTGSTTLAHVTIGDRYTGAIMPVRLADEAAS